MDLRTLRWRHSSPWIVPSPCLMIYIAIQQNKFWLTSFRYKCFSLLTHWQIVIHFCMHKELILLIYLAFSKHSPLVITTLNPRTIGKNTMSTWCSTFYSWLANTPSSDLAPTRSVLSVGSSRLISSISEC